MADHTFTQETQKPQSKQMTSMDLSSISITGLIDLYEAFEAEQGVVLGILNRPRCHSDETGGRTILEDRFEKLGDAYCDVGNELARRSPADDDEREAQAYLLLRFAHACGDSLTDALSIVSNAIAVKH
ncbi:MAG: hypothetical protein P1U50_01130 [Parvibaculaceae bacterium]|nr:hypothetical protein [Parvibaculaceae bacterium]